MPSVPGPCRRGRRGSLPDPTRSAADLRRPERGWNRLAVRRFNGGRVSTTADATPAGDVESRGAAERGALRSTCRLPAGADLSGGRLRRVAHGRAAGREMVDRRLRPNRLGRMVADPGSARRPARRRSQPHDAGDRALRSRRRRGDAARTVDGSRSRRARPACSRDRAVGRLSRRFSAASIPTPEATAETTSEPSRIRGVFRSAIVGPGERGR